MPLIGSDQNSRLPPIRFAIGAAIVMLFMVAAIVVAYDRPVPAFRLTQVATATAIDGPRAVLPWPTVGAAAVLVEGVGTIGVSNDELLRPLASVTKIMTALLILERHPLGTDDSGPTITIVHDDVVEFLREAGEGQSVVGVTEGEQITERQLLEGLLIPSANNFADRLARWDAGSGNAFVSLMNARAEALGMAKTRYSDASGISRDSVGTAGDQVRLTSVAMQNPVFARIVRQQEATLPFAGTVHATNRLLREGAFVGVKTGNTSEAGGCFVFASEHQTPVGAVRIIGAVLGAPSLDGAFAASKELDDAVAKVMHHVVVLPHDEVVAHLRSAWGASTELVPAADVALLGWSGLPVKVFTEVNRTTAPIAAGDEVGSVTVVVGDQRKTVPLRAAGALPKPGRLWRIIRW